MAARRRNSKIDLRFLYQGGRRVPQAGQPAPPLAQMLALTSYFYFPTSTSILLQSTFFFSGADKTEGTSKLLGLFLRSSFYFCDELSFF